MSVIIGTRCKLAVTTLCKNRDKIKNLINKIKWQFESVTFVQELEKNNTKLLRKKASNSDRP